MSAPRKLAFPSRWVKPSDLYRERYKEGRPLNLSDGILEDSDYDLPDAVFAANKLGDAFDDQAPAEALKMIESKTADPGVVVALLVRQMFFGVPKLRCVSQYIDSDSRLAGLNHFPALAMLEPAKAFAKVPWQELDDDASWALKCAFSAAVLLQEGNSFSAEDLPLLFEQGCPMWLPCKTVGRDAKLCDVLHCYANIPYHERLEQRDRWLALAAQHVDDVIANNPPTAALALLDENLALIEAIDPHFLADSGIAKKVAALPYFHGAERHNCGFGYAMQPVTLKAFAKAGAKVTLCYSDLPTRAGWLANQPGRTLEDDIGFWRDYCAVGGIESLAHAKHKQMIVSVGDHNPQLALAASRFAGVPVGYLQGSILDATTLGKALTAISNLHAAGVKVLKEDRDGDSTKLARNELMVLAADIETLAAACTTPARLSALLRVRSDAADVLPHLDKKLRTKAMDALVDMNP